MKLLQNYLNLWNNRKVELDNVAEQEHFQLLLERELNDELTHPRLRKTIHEKFSLAVARIIDSNLPNDDKIELIEAFRDVLAKIENRQKK
ncbi:MULTISPECIES: hypothetical protein [Sutcliffiella]|uniref:hypothetical protein n=1 Tax=Sutcliffiella TaxID=2837511 RepID=UPI0022DE6A9A|nr:MULTISPECIES: hypothetical protein [Sutcliffiella]MED4017562.1 hypothetical protein [Sutcliffiella cohnii]WBL15988.1 hypothetical protein O1A01_04960 [Sutcliffiella sp. NC1]